MIVELIERLHAVISAGVALVDDRTALIAPEIYPSWEWLVEQDYEVKKEEVPMRFQFGGQLYKCIKAGKTFKSEWVPGVGTASIFMRVANEDESGTIENPIEAARGMEYEYGKYYHDPEDGKVYLCKRGEEIGTITLQFLPHELIDHYFVEVAV